MANYRLLFDGMLASSQTSTTPPALLAGLLMPWGRNGQTRARVAPLGLRRIEAALLSDGFSTNDVAVVDEQHLRHAIGPATKIVAMTSGEPAGGGMNSTTMTGVAGGSIYPEVMFQKMLREVQRCIAASAPSAKVVIGGPGAWQLAQDPESLLRLGISHVVTGYAEGNAASIFRALLDDANFPQVISGHPVTAADIPQIQGASTMGVVEISRGCGLGCSFCTIARIPMIHIPEATIIADARLNVATGQTSIAVLSEDFFRYGANGMSADPQAVISILNSLRQIDGLRLIQIDHANVSSIAQFSDEELKTIHDLLVGETGCKYPWVNVGVETSSSELLGANGGAAKMGQCGASGWKEFSAEQLRRLCRVGFLPMVSLIVGLPREKEQDVRLTLDWVEGMKDERITIFPVLYAPIDGGPGVGRESLTNLHWCLIRASYRLNFKWLPRMYWDNQTGAGIHVGRRIVLQTLGLGQVVQWNALFAWHAWKARRRVL
ncbi:MAG: radical SAM protein [Armatimonadota bacterium]